MPWWAFGGEFFSTGRARVTDSDSPLANCPAQEFHKQVLGSSYCLRYVPMHGLVVWPVALVVPAATTYACQEVMPSRMVKYTYLMYVHYRFRLTGRGDRKGGKTRRGAGE